MGALAGVIECVALWYAAWGIFAYALWMRGIGYARHFLISTLYFLFVGALAAAFFWRTLQEAVLPFQAFPLEVLAAFMLLLAIGFAFAGALTSLPSDYLARYPMREYLVLDPRRLASKSADIFAQQVFIVLIVLFLRDAGLSLWQTTIGFAVAFAFVHIPPVAKEWGRWPAWAFSGAVLFFSATFPYLIVRVPYGFAYTFIIHWLFYVGMAVAFRLCSRRAISGGPYGTKFERFSGI